jgi:PTS system nitrogen regulatory IIA component
MKITDMLRREFVLEEMAVAGKREALTALTDLFARGGVKISPGAMLPVLLEREKLGSTGIGEGIAIPHGKVGGLEEMLVAFGRSRAGVAFDAMDGKPVHLFFLLMAPDNSAGLHLKALAKISRMLRDPQFRKSLLEAPDQAELYRIIAEKDDEN